MRAMTTQKAPQVGARTYLVKYEPPPVLARLLRKDEIEKDSQQVSGEQALMGRHEHPFNMDELGDLATANLWHAACITAKAVASVGLGYRFAAKRGEDDSAERDKAEDLVPDNSFSGFCAEIVEDLESCGNAYIEVERGKSASEIARLNLVPPGTMWVMQDGNYQQRIGTKTAIFVPYGSKERDGRNEILHIKTRTPRSRYYGLPKWLGAIPDLILDQNAVLYQIRFFENSAMPDFAVIVEGGELTEDAEKKIADLLSTNFKGVNNAHRTIYIPSPDPSVKIRLEPLNKIGRDADFVGLRAQSRDFVVSAHRVPPRIVGIVTAGQLGGGGETIGQLQIFDQTVCDPIRQKLGKILGKTIFEEVGITSPITFTALDVTSWSEDAEAVARLKEAGLIWPAEGRERLGYDGDGPSKNLDATLDELNRQLA